MEQLVTVLISARSVMSLQHCECTITDLHCSATKKNLNNNTKHKIEMLDKPFPWQDFEYSRGTHGTLDSRLILTDNWSTPNGHFGIAILAAEHNQNILGTRKTMQDLLTSQRHHRRMKKTAKNSMKMMRSDLYVLYSIFYQT